MGRSAQGAAEGKECEPEEGGRTAAEALIWVSGECRGARGATHLGDGAGHGQEGRRGEAVRRGNPDKVVAVQGIRYRWQRRRHRRLCTI